METLLAFLVVGIAFASPTGGEERWTVAAVGLVLALMVVWRHRDRPHTGWLALLGVASGVGSTLWCQPEPVTIPETLMVQTTPMTAQIVDREERVDGVRLLLSGLTAPGPPSWQAPGLVRVMVRKHPVTAVPGDLVTITAKLRDLNRPEPRWGFRYQSYLRRHDIVAEGSSSQPVEVIGRERGWEWNHFRHQISEAVSRSVVEEQQGLAEGMLVGKRGRMTQETSEALQAAGVFHLVAISGFQVGMVGGWSYFILRLLLVLLTPWSARWDVKRVATVLAIGPTLAYAFVTGWSVATLRATIMVVIFLMSMAAGRSSQVWHTLGLTMVVVLLIDPENLFDAGFQLSFGAVAVLVWTMRRLEGRQSPIEAARAVRPSGGSPPAKTGLFRRWLFILVVSSAAVDWMMTPLSAHHFHRLSFYGLPANLLAVPWVNLVTVPLALAALVAMPVTPDWADLLIRWVGQSMEVIRIPAGWIAGWPGGWYRLPGPSLTGVALFVVAVLGAATATSDRRRLPWVVAALLGLFWPGAQSWPGLSVAALDVGQAQAAVVRSPDGSWSVVDAGGMVSPYYDVGEAVISNYLWYYGAKSLERVVVSHFQQDHYAGAGRLLRNFPVKALWLPPVVDGELLPVAVVKLLELAERRRLPVLRMAANPQGGDGQSDRHRPNLQDGEGAEAVAWRILHPVAGSKRGKANNHSLVVEVAYRDHRFLFPADLEAPGERSVLAGGQARPVTVMMVPHHGSKSSSSPEWIAALRPEQVVFSVGLRNRYRFPHPAVEERWRRSGARLYRTDRDGTVVFVSDGHQVSVVTP